MAPKVTQHAAQRIQERGGKLLDVVAGKGSLEPVVINRKLVTVIPKDDRRVWRGDDISEPPAGAAVVACWGAIKHVVGKKGAQIKQICQEFKV